MRAPRAEADWLLIGLLIVLVTPQLRSGWWGDPAGQAGYMAVTLVLIFAILPRHRYPVAMFAAAATISALQIAFGIQLGQPGPVFALQPSDADWVMPVLLYNLAATRPRRVSIAGLMVCLAGAVVAVARWGPSHQPYAGTAILGAGAGLCGVALTAWVLGDTVAYRRRAADMAALETRAARLEAERDAQARIAAAAERERELTERRARVVDQAEARLRRIERDLHDGAQVRLTALAMTIGELKENLAHRANPEAAAALAAAAHAGAKETLAELRDLARGIHPAVLDRGLPPALSVLAETCAVPVTVAAAVEDRPSIAIEAIAYFCAAELLANVVKHATAGKADISLRDKDGRLMLTVSDDGAGGATVRPGGGLAGLTDRVQTVDGRLTVDSPPGGPTVMTVELPVHA